MFASSPRAAPRKSRTSGNPATAKTFAPPDKVTRQYRKEFNLLLDRIPDCDLDLATALVATHHSTQRRSADGKLERLQLKSAHDAQGRSVTWIELVKGERSFPQRSSAVITPAKSKSQGKGKQRRDDSEDEVDEHVLPATDDEQYAEASPSRARRTPRESAAKVGPSSSPKEAVATPPEEGRAPLDGSVEAAVESNGGSASCDELANELNSQLSFSPPTNLKKRGASLSPSLSLPVHLLTSCSRADSSPCSCRRALHLGPLEPAPRQDPALRPRGLYAD